MLVRVTPDPVKFQFEYDERIRCAFIGAGDHAFRNVYPALQYAPVDLLATCDVREDRAEAYARQFGARTHYANHHELLERERPDAVFIVTAYDNSTGRVQATDLALDCLRSGAHVWMEKPTAASTAEIEELRKVSTQAGRFVMTGLKKIFTPAMTKVKQLIEQPEFGTVASISVRYPQDLPPPEKRHDLLSMRGFLDHIYHPAAILGFLGGPIERFSYEWEPSSGSSVASLPTRRSRIMTLHQRGDRRPAPGGRLGALQPARTRRGDRPGRERRRRQRRQGHVLPARREPRLRALRELPRRRRQRADRVGAGVLAGTALQQEPVLPRLRS